MQHTVNDGGHAAALKGTGATGLRPAKFAIWRFARDAPRLRVVQALDVRPWRREVRSLFRTPLLALRAGGERGAGERKREGAERRFSTAHATGTSRSTACAVSVVMQLPRIELAEPLYSQQATSA